MRLLCDTHILLWAASGRLPKKADDLLNDADNELFFSAVNFWEIAIKRGKGLANFRVDPRVLRRSLVSNGYAELPVTSDHAMETEHLPDHHSDPFDRLLVAQATVEGVYLLTADPRIERYPGPIIKV